MELSGQKNNRVWNIAAGILFVLFIIIGLSVYDDYGVWVDDEIQRQHGVITYRWLNRKIFDRGVFIETGTEDLPNYAHKYYGVAVQLPMVFAEDIYQMVNGHEPMPLRTIYRMRHLYVHCIYLFGLFCFYLMLKDLFRSSRSGIAGVLMIYSFGRLFSHSFYNIKDSVFVSLIMVSLFCAVRVLKTGYSTKWCLLFAVSSAFAVSSRIVGALLPALLLILIITEHLLRHQRLPVKAIILICLAYPIWLLITPASWTDPLVFSVNCATKFSDYDGLRNPRVLFGGEVLRQKDIPADFYLRWIGLTVPLVYLFFSVCGLAVFLYKSIKRKISDALQFKILFIMLGVFLVTILYQVFRHPTVYSDWRHIFFVYPLIISFAVFGIEEIYEQKNKWVRVLSAGMLTVSLIYNLGMMYINHPAEFMAYNPIGQRVANLYQGDYWGMSKLHLLTWIAEHDSQKTRVGIYPDTHNNRLGLKKDWEMLDDAKKAKMVIRKHDSDYIITWFSSLAYAFGMNPPVIEGFERVYTVSSYGADVTAVYKRSE